MKKEESMSKRIVLDLLGVLLLLWGVSAIANQLYLGNFYGILWLSYYTLILVGIGILTKNSFLINAQLVIILIPYIVWNIDFFYILFTGQQLWNIAGYFFNNVFLFSNIITLQHIFIIPVALFALWVIKIKRFDFWKLAFLEVAIIYVISRVITPADLNINCVYKSCIPLQSVFPQAVTWFVSFFVMIIISTYILKRLKFLHKNE